MLLFKIQQSLKVPKNQRNSFGNYNYRSAEDILEAAKKVLKDHNAVIFLTDEIVSEGGKNYVKATATITDGNETYSATAYAREEESKKGMDASQITGSCSSYARKYAMNGLFAIDDTKDSDATNTHDKNVEAFQPSIDEWTKQIQKIQTIEKLQEFYFDNEKAMLKSKELITIVNNHKKTLETNGNSN